MPRRLFKSKSATSLRGVAEDDVFAPSTNTTESSMPSFSGQVAQNIQAQETKEIGYQGFKPREDRGKEVNAANAQGLLPPDAAVFCAK